VLIRSDGALKLSDFGLCRPLHKRSSETGIGAARGGPTCVRSSGAPDEIHAAEPEYVARPYTPQVQSRWYRAPEILYGSGEYSEAIDLWSAGCIFGELAYGGPLFPGSSDIDQLYRVVQVSSSHRYAHDSPTPQRAIKCNVICVVHCACRYSACLRLNRGRYVGCFCRLAGRRAASRVFTMPASALWLPAMFSYSLLAGVILFSRLR
jgi:serine/threonine protein kinase